MTDPDPNPFGNCDVIVCGAGLFDKHLASRIHSVDDEIFGWLQRPCVSSQATCSARLRPPGHFRIVARIPDLRTDGNRAADHLTKYGNRTTCDAPTL